MLRATLLSSVLLGLLPLQSASAEEVILDYEATAQTVVGTPFGFTVPRLTVVTGVIVYQTDGAVDDNPSPERGNYQLTAGGAFVADFLDHRILGSATPLLQVEDIQIPPSGSIDTFRFIDGDDSDQDGGIMSLDDIADGDVELFLAMTDDSGEAFTSDLLPTIFPMFIHPGGPSIPHTFSLKDDDGTMLLQFNWITQRLPNILKIIEVGFVGENPAIKFHSKPNKNYRVEFTTDLATWQVIAPNLPSQGYLTDFVDEEIATRLGSLPEEAFYRVSEIAGD
jgi:hypothetical protein